MCLRVDRDHVVNIRQRNLCNCDLTPCYTCHTTHMHSGARAPGRHSSLLTTKRVGGGDRCRNSSTPHRLRSRAQRSASSGVSKVSQPSPEGRPRPSVPRKSVSRSTAYPSKNASISSRAARKGSPRTCNQHRNAFHWGRMTWSTSCAIVVQQQEHHAAEPGEQVSDTMSAAVADSSGWLPAAGSRP